MAVVLLVAACARPVAALDAPATADDDARADDAADADAGNARAGAANSAVAGEPPTERKARVVIVGDVLLHGALQRGAERDPAGYAGLLGDTVSLLREADLTIANLEGPAAAGVTPYGRVVPDPGRYDGFVYTSYPAFNYRPALLDALADAGVDVLGFANNHTIDRGAVGVRVTLAAIRARGMVPAGVREKGDPAPHPHAVVTAGPFRVAVIACTYGVNGRDVHGHAMPCFDPPDAVADRIREVTADPAVHAVIVTPHWGYEYEPAPRRAERAYARAWAEAGATAIVGSHPHVVQPVDIITAGGRAVPVAYSLGNFVSGQAGVRRTLGAAAVLTLAATGTTRPAATIETVAVVTRRVNGRIGTYRLAPRTGEHAARAAWNAIPGVTPLPPEPER